MKQITLLLLLLIILALLVVPLPADPAGKLPNIVAAEANPTAINVGPSWDSPPPGTLLSTNAPLGAEIPIIRSAPDGSLLMVVYHQLITSGEDRDPYYTISLDNGYTWSTPSPIFSTPLMDSGNTQIAFDTNNNVHTVWREPDRIYYSRFDGNWSQPQTISPLVGQIYGNDYPSITTSVTNTIDVVWAQNATNNQRDIFHTRSVDGGQSWSSPSPVFSSMPSSTEPSVVVDTTGYLHVIWKERVGEGGYEIRYTQGIPSGSSIFWAAPLVISSIGTLNANNPRINLVNDDLHVTYTDTVDGTPTVQFIHYTVCGSNCILTASWSSPQNISQQAVVVNQSDPYYLVSELVNGNCLFVFFHGKQSDQANETVWDINSCSGWNNGGRDQVTDPADRAIYPSATINNGLVHAAYQRVDGSDRQIYYMRGNLPQGVFLPFFRKP